MHSRREINYVRPTKNSALSQTLEGLLKPIRKLSSNPEISTPYGTAIFGRKFVRAKAANQFFGGLDKHEKKGKRKCNRWSVEGTHSPNQCDVHAELRLVHRRMYVSRHMYVNGRIGSARSYVSVNPEVQGINLGCGKMCSLRPEYFDF